MGARARTGGGGGGRRRGPGPEALVVRCCLEYLRLVGVMAWRNNTGSLRNAAGRPVRFGAPGSADVLGVLPGGRFLAVECKRPGGRLSQAQADWLAAVERAGGVAAVVTSIEDLRRALQAAGLSEIAR